MAGVGVYIALAVAAVRNHEVLLDTISYGLAGLYGLACLFLATVVFA